MAALPQTAELKARVSPEMKAQIVALAAQVGESEGVIIRQALNAYLAKIAGKSTATLYPEHHERSVIAAEDHQSAPLRVKAGRKSSAA